MKKGNMTSKARDRLNIQNVTAHHAKIKSFSNSPTGQSKNNKDWWKKKTQIKINDDVQ